MSSARCVMLVFGVTMLCVSSAHTESKPSLEGKTGKSEVLKGETLRLRYRKADGKMFVEVRLGDMVMLTDAVAFEHKDQKMTFIKLGESRLEVTVGDKELLAAKEIETSLWNGAFSYEDPKVDFNKLFIRDVNKLK